MKGAAWTPGGSLFVRLEAGGWRLGAGGWRTRNPEPNLEPGTRHPEPQALHQHRYMPLPPPVLTWSLRIERARVGDVDVFAPVGRLGMLSSGDLIEALVGAVKEGARRLVVDFAGVDYISSAGLLALNAISERVHQAGGDLVLCGLVVPVRLAFELAGLLPDFSVEPSRELALARLAHGRTPMSPADG